MHPPGYRISRQFRPAILHRENPCDLSASKFTRARVVGQAQRAVIKQLKAVVFGQLKGNQIEASYVNNSELGRRATAQPRSLRVKTGPAGRINARVPTFRSSTLIPSRSVSQGVINPVGADWRDRRAPSTLRASWRR